MSSPALPTFAPHCDECPLRLTGVVDATTADGWRACQCTYHATCRECGWPIVDDAAYRDHCGLCAACLLKGRPPEDRHELQALLRTLKIAPDSVAITFSLWAGEALDERWANFRVEWALIPDITWHHPPSGHVVVHPWRVRLPGGDTPQILLRWRAWRPDARGFLEMYFEGEHHSAIPHRFRSSLREFDQNATASALKQFADLTRTPGLPGRPTRSGMLLANKTFLDDLFVACEAVFQRTRAQPTLIEVAQELDKQPSDDTVRRRLRDHGLPRWKDALVAWQTWRMTKYK